MPDKISVDRLRHNLQKARRAVDTLYSTLGAIEGEVAALELESQTLDYLDPGGQVEVQQLTEEELGIASVKMLVTFREAGGLLGVSPAAVRDMVDRGELPACRLGRQTARIPVKQLQEYIEALRAGEGEG